MVDRALKYGASRLNFVPTHYYLESSSGDVRGYCYMDAGYDACKHFDEVRLIESRGSTRPMRLGSRANPLTSNTPHKHAPVVILRREGHGPSMTTRSHAPPPLLLPQEGIRSFHEGISLCLAHATGAGMQSVSIIPHLDR